MSADLDIIINGEKEINTKKGLKIFFDLIFQKDDFSFKIVQCFVEKGKYGDWMLRLPTKMTPKGYYQINWLDNKTFNTACEFIRKRFEGRD